MEKNISKFDAKFIKGYDENNDKEYILEEDVENILKICMIYIMIYHFNQNK